MWQDSRPAGDGTSEDWLTSMSPQPFSDWGSFVAWHGELGPHSAPLAAPEKELSRLRKIRFRTR
jgi:hypothetical protein